MYTNIIKTKIIGSDDVYKFNARYICVQFCYCCFYSGSGPTPLLPLPEHMYLNSGLKAQCGRYSRYDLTSSMESSTLHINI
jgi:hypothetical protein